VDKFFIFRSVISRIFCKHKQNSIFGLIEKIFHWFRLLFTEQSHDNWKICNRYINQFCIENLQRDLFSIACDIYVTNRKYHIMKNDTYDLLIMFRLSNNWCFKFSSKLYVKSLWIVSIGQFLVKKKHMHTCCVFDCLTWVTVFSCYSHSITTNCLSITIDRLLVCKN
jgi:hypothetical protein